MHQSPRPALSKLLRSKVALVLALVQFSYTAMILQASMVQPSFLGLAGGRASSLKPPVVEWLLFVRLICKTNEFGLSLKGLFVEAAVLEQASCYF